MQWVVDCSSVLVQYYELCASIFEMDVIRPCSSLAGRLGDGCSHVSLVCLLYYTNKQQHVIIYDVRSATMLYYTWTAQSMQNSSPLWVLGHYFFYLLLVL